MKKRMIVLVASALMVVGSRGRRGGTSEAR